MNTTGWLKGLEVTADGTGIVSHSGVALLRALSDRTGLTAGLSRALAADRLLIHDRGRVLADLACTVADGAEVISDFRVMTDQAELFGLVASVPTAWRTLDEIAAGGGRAQARITRAINAARRRAWAAIETRHGALPGVRVADKMLEGVTCLRLDASVVACHSDKAWPWANAMPPPGPGSQPCRRPPDQQQAAPATRKEQPRGLWNPGHPARQPGHRHTQTLKSPTVQQPSRRPTPAIRPRESSGLSLAAWPQGSECGQSECRDNPPRCFPDFIMTAG